MIPISLTKKGGNMNKNFFAQLSAEMIRVVDTFSHLFSAPVL